MVTSILNRDGSGRVPNKPLLLLHGASGQRVHRDMRSVSKVPRRTGSNIFFKNERRKQKCRLLNPKIWISAARTSS